MDIETLCRLQFGITASFHIIFPSLLIGLSSFLSFLYWRWMRTNDASYFESYKLWLNVLVVVYLIAAISGVALSAQLDNMFGGFYEKAEAALIPIRNVELLFAILLEGGCIGVMLLHCRNGRSKGRLAATLGFNFGIFLTAFLIISRNSWMNTPAGVEWIDGQVVLLNQWEVIFNPSFPLRYLHMLTAGMMATAFMVLGFSAYRYLKKGPSAATTASLRLGLAAACILTVVQFVVGDLHGSNVLQNQPMKIAAMEGQWETEKGASFKVFAIPDEENEKNDFSIEIPYGLSMILNFDPTSEVKGLKEIAPEERPNVGIVFYSFRIMIAMAMLMMITAAIGFWLRRKGKLETTTWYLKMAIVVAPAGLIAVIAGWIVAEVGRQPWAVYGVIPTAHTVTAQSAEQVMSSFIFFSAVYIVLTIAGILAIRAILLADKQMVLDYSRLPKISLPKLGWAK
ncbi:cytochrome ubiquinol oxidase subunit I [Pseudomonadota bacterium]